MEGIFRRRRLPHWDLADATYFVTSCLAGSIPTIGLQALKDFRQSLDAQARPPILTEGDWEHHKGKLMFAKLDEWLDGRPAVRHLEAPLLAAAVQDAMFQFAGTRYQLLAYVIMPSHFHWLFHPIPDWCARIAEGDRERTQTPRETIMHSLKSYTANKCNRILKRKGAFWQDESYDHWVRNDEELLRIIEYIEANPVKASICALASDHIYSSAYDRKVHGIAPGEPLIPR